VISKFIFRTEMIILAALEINPDGPGLTTICVIKEGEITLR